MMWQIEELILVFHFFLCSRGELWQWSTVMALASLAVVLHPPWWQETIVPGPHSSFFHFGFTEASIFGMLTDFSFLHHLQRELASPLFTKNSYLLGVFGSVIKTLVWAQRMYFWILHSKKHHPVGILYMWFFFCSTLITVTHKKFFCI